MLITRLYYSIIMHIYTNSFGDEQYVGLCLP